MERSIEVKTRFETGAVRVTVTDAGPGLDPEIAARLFEPFQSTKPGGLGLGLTICHTIIESHGGRIELKSNQPHGTAASFVLPIQANPRQS